MLIDAPVTCWSEVDSRTTCSVTCSFSFDPQRVQVAVLRFYDKPWKVDSHRCVRSEIGRYSRPLQGVQSSPKQHY